jgi:hypothetical protein
MNKNSAYSFAVASTVTVLEREITRIKSLKDSHVFVGGFVRKWVPRKDRIEELSNRLAAFIEVSLEVATADNRRRQQAAEIDRIISRGRPYRSVR